MEKATRGQIFDYAIIAIVAAVLGYAFVGGYYGVQSMKANNDVADFHKSAGCVAAGVATDPLQPNCAWGDYTVRGQEIRKERGKVTYHLSLSQTQGLVPDLEVSRAVYLQNPIGSTLQVETWGDVAVAVNDSTGIHATQTNPVVVAREAGRTVGLVTGIFFAVIAAAVLVLAWTTRILVASKPAPDYVDDPDVVADTAGAVFAKSDPPAPSTAPFPVKDDTIPWRAVIDDPEDDDNREDW